MPEHKIIYREDATKPGFNIGVVLNRKPVAGNIGLEIEVEGNQFPKPEGHEGTHHPVQMPDSKFWSYVHDGSLRGEDNAEYVLTKPVAFDQVPPAIDELYDTLKKYGSKLDVSNRTSVHVHLNCQEFHMNRLASFLCAWFAVEEILVEWCGEHRVGNLFCLRAVDAPAIVNHIRKFIRTDGNYPLNEMLHYGGLNPSALHKHGSLEIRTLRGCTDDPKVVLNWVSILQRLYELSAKFTDPRELVSTFSSGGPLSFFDFLLADKAAVVRAGLSWTDNEISDAMFRGIRFAQDLAFCRDWSDYKPMTLKPDPFSRDMRKIAAKLQSAEDSSMPVAGSPYYADEDDEMPAPPQGNPWNSLGVSQFMQEYAASMSSLQSQVQQLEEPPHEDLGWN
jgi:hypothetical protein